MADRPLRVLSIVGTRPEAIKMAPVITRLRDQGDRVCAMVCVTGQHRQIADQMLDYFGVGADFDLDLMEEEQSLCGLVAGLVDGLGEIVDRTRPDWVLAQGDTASVLAAGMVSYFQRVRFGHVEAGLRTGDRNNPFPEEVNRRYADMVADLLFAPTGRAR